MKKNFVLDTNVLLHDSACLRAFADNVVNIPIYVIEELDQFKKDQTELGRNARRIAREIDTYRVKGNLREGVALPTGGIVRVVLDKADLPKDFSVGHAFDNSILAVALWLNRTESDTPAVFVSKDTNLRIRADALGIRAEDYDREQMELSELYSGSAELDVAGELIDRCFAEGGFERSLLNGAELFPNQYLTLRNIQAAGRTALARVTPDRIEAVHRPKGAVWGVQARNREQTFALDMLLRDDIQMCTLVGKAGTGKTLLAIAAGLQSVLDGGKYRKLLVSRPIFPMGKDLGHLPGTLGEKLNPWMQPIHDNIDFLTTANASSGKQKAHSYADFLSQGIIEVEPLTYIRGRSLPQIFMIVDEAQNLTPHEVKTVLTRVGHSTKIIFTGDPHQIDHAYLDSVNNGLTHLVEKFKNEPLAAHVTLSKGERSPLAELAANLL
ncbi:MAG: PhoH family protein [Myxococcales bacterium]|nr:PhoH family protein [Myxococcales bacterium]